jgi:drug/metabolite transporter (DMT)-like permease
MENYILLALVVSFLWGISPVIHKHLLSKFHLITIMIFSCSVYFVLILCLSMFHSKELLADINKMRTNDTLILLGVPVFTMFLANVIYLYILKDHESSIISALIYSSPVFTLIIAYLFLNERLDMYGLSGFFAIILGVVLISQNNRSYRNLEFLSNK